MNSKAAKIWRVIEILTWGEDYFRKKGIEQPRLHIEHLLAHVLKRKRLELYLSFDMEVDQKDLNELKALMKRLFNKEPLMYILGETEFYGVKIKVNSKVLIPRPETEIMVDEVMKCFKNKRPGRIIDLGTGSGCISIALAKMFEGCLIRAVDSSEESIEIARHNAEINGFLNDIEFIHGDMIDLLQQERDIDLVVSNPPYISIEEYEKLDISVKNFEPKHALTDGKDGTSYLAKILDYLHNALSLNGLAFMEFGYLQENWVRNYAGKSGLAYEILPDLHGIARIIKVFKK